MSASLPLELRSVLDALLAAGAATGRVSLDAIGEALGDRPVSSPEIDALIGAIEAAGCTIDGGEGRGGLEALRIVLPAARRLTAETGRAPTVEAIASSTGLADREVRRALLLARTLSR